MRMATIDNKTAQKIKSLYETSKLSAPQISEKTGYSLNEVYYAMRKYNVKRRTPADHNKITFENKPFSFSVKKSLSPVDEKLRLTGSLLYWCEGYKTEKSKGIDFANSDVGMIICFVKFLRNICGVDEKRLRVLLYCHSSCNINLLITHWSAVTNIPKSQFTKPYVMKTYTLDKKDKMPYGLVHIRYADKKLLRLIMSWIDECKANI